VITRTTSSWVAGLVALALLGAACSSASSPEVVDPAATPAETPATEAGTEAADERSTEPVASEQEDGSEGQSESSGAEPEGDTSEPDTPAAPETLQFTAPLVGGGEIDLAAGFDSKPTVFWFWAPT